ncbi:MAG: BppU family phage baseplate upper protein [Bacillota bacterium]|nr:BppU family phage baseplate upper protein [Bacillota bacterium]
MTQINKNFTLSFTSDSSIPTYQFKSGEVLSRKLFISLIQNEVAFDLTGFTAKIYIQKPDNTKIFDNCVIEDAEIGLISYVLTTQCTTSIGISKAEIVIYGTNNEKIISQTFQFEITEAIEDDSAIESTDEFTTLMLALNDVSSFKTEMTNAHYDNTTNKVYNDIGARLDAQSASLNLKADYPPQPNEYLNGVCLVTNPTYPYGYVERFGAVGDGITDCSTAINNCIQCASVNTSTSVFFGRTGKGRVYLIKGGSIIITNTSLKHIWMDGSVLKIDSTNINNNNLFPQKYAVLCNTSDGINAAGSVYATRIIIHGLTINGQSLAGTRGILIGDHTEIDGFMMQNVRGINIGYLPSNFLDRIYIHDGTITTNDAVDYPRTEYAINIQGIRGNNGIIENIEFSTGGYDYTQPVKAIRVNASTGRTLKIANIMNGEIYLSNCQCTLERIHGESGSIILENTAVVVKDSEIFCQGKVNNVPFDPIVIKDNNGLCRNVKIENCTFTADTHLNFASLPLLRHIVIKDTYTGQVTIDNCSMRNRPMYTSTDIGVFVSRLNTDGTYTNIGYALSKYNIFDKNGLVSVNYEFNKYTDINNINNISISYLQSSAISGSAYNPFTTSTSEMLNLLFFGKTGAYTFRFFVFDDYDKNLGYEVIKNDKTVVSDNTKIFAIKLNMPIENRYVGVYVYVDNSSNVAVPYQYALFRVTVNNPMLIYDGRHINGMTMNTFSSVPTPKTNYEKVISTGGSNRKIIGTFSSLSTTNTGFIKNDEIIDIDNSIKRTFNGTSWINLNS